MSLLYPHSSDRPLGLHYILELYGCPQDLLNDSDLICQSLRQAAREANSTLLNAVHHRFEPHGVTALALLAESHISIHTWPESGYAAVDVFTCGESTTPKRACEYLIEVLRADRYTLQAIDRGAVVSAADERTSRSPVPSEVSRGPEA